MYKGKKDSKFLLVSSMAYILMFVELPYFSQYNLLRYCIIMFLSVFVFSQYKKIFREKYKVINTMAIVFGIATIYTSYINQGRTVMRNPFLASIVFVLTFWLFLFYIEIVSEDRRFPEVIDIFYKMTMMLIIITDLMMFFMPEMVKKHQGNFFIGTKFNVVYFHIFLLMIYMTRNYINNLSNENRWGLRFIFLLSFVVSIFTQCATGLVGLVLYFLIVRIFNKSEKIFLNRTLFITSILLSYGFIYFYETVLGNSLIQTFINDVIERDTTLTSRTRIYSTVPQLLSNKSAWYTGFGYGSSYELGMKYGGFPNTQNGLLEWIWQIGVPATIILLIMLFAFMSVIRKSQNRINKKMIIPMVTILYVFIILSTVEITYGLLFIGIFCCCIGLSEDESLQMQENGNVD